MVKDNKTAVNLILEVRKDNTTVCSVVSVALQPADVHLTTLHSESLTQK
jgi:hypothetical protein